MSQWNLQSALYTRLNATPDVTGLLAGGIHDHVPATAAFPYAVITGIRSQPLDTQTHAGMEHSVTIRSYSTGTGMKQIRGIMAAIRVALHDADFTVPGHDLILCREVSADSMLDPDGETRRGSQTFRIITEAL